MNKHSFLTPYSLLLIPRLAVFAVLCLAVMAWAENNVPYLDESGVERIANGVTVIDANGGERTLSAGWYLVRGALTNSGTITIDGTVHLILENNSDLTVRGSSGNAGINVSEGDSLTIYAYSVSEDMGKLTATGSSYSGAGIGGGSGGNGGTITINGGAVTATGSSGAAGIGGGSGGNGGTIAINGGVVTATGGRYGAGIGGGIDGSGGTITITDGTVVAIGGSGYYGGTGIGGGGDCGSDGCGSTITITGGTVVAITSGGYYGGAGIGGGISGTFTLDGNAVVVTSSVNAGNRILKNGILFIFNIGTGTIFEGTPVTEHFPTNGMTAVWKNQGGKSGIYVSGNKAGFIEVPSVTVIEHNLINNVLYIDTNGETKTANNVIVLGEDDIAAIDNLNGWFLVRGNNLTRNATLRISGEAHIILEDGSSLAVTGSSDNAGINVSESNSLTIYAQSTGNSMGRLTAIGDSDDTGIGGGGTITISGGTVTATGGNYGAGIGGNGSTITISGGTVTATGYGRAGIGGGYGGSNCTIIISGGTVTAISSDDWSAGIGDGGTFTLDGNAVVFTNSIGTTGENRILKSGILFIFDIGTATILEGTPVTEHFPAEGMTAAWKNQDGKSGIAYESGNKQGFIEVPGVTVIERNLINNVLYIDTNGETKTANNVIVLGEDNIAAIDHLNGWFLIRGNNLTRSTTLRISGEAHIILEDGSDLTVTGSSDNAGINVSEGNSLTIYAQSADEDVGKLVATGGFYGAGIGGGSGGSGGTVTVIGGTVTATGGSLGAGIGGGYGGSGGTVTITGGTVIATGGSYDTGIGGGSGGSGGTVTISGGTVTASGSVSGGAGINTTAVTITGGTVTATSSRGAGIGGSTFTLDGNATVFASSISATGENRTLKNGILFIAAIGTGTFFEGTPVTEYFPAEGMTAAWENQGGKSGIAYANRNRKGFIEVHGVTVIGRKSISNVPYIDSDGTTQIANDVIVLDEGNISSVDHLNGWFLVSGDLERNATLRISSMAHIILEDGGSLAVTGSSNNAGINVSEGNSLSIYAQSMGNDMGKLTATGGFSGVGIGGGNGGNGGTVTITGGTVTATGGSYGSGAGIGGDGGTVTITGGTVTATGDGYGAGIGGNNNGGNTVTITGGTVMATGGIYAAGIGNRYGSNYGSTFALNGNAVVYASGVSDNDESKRTSGILFVGNNGKVYSSVELQEDLEIESSYTLTLLNEATLTIPSGITLTNNGTITPANGSTIIINGTVNGENKIDGANTTLLSTTTKTLTSITLDGTADLLATTGQEIEYAISQTNDAPATGWQTETTFTGLAEKADYWIFARSKENTHFAAGAVSAGLQVSTKATPTLADLRFNIPRHIYNGEAQGIGNVTGSTFRIDIGAITVYYNGSPDKPANVGKYIVTVDIAESTEFVEAEGIVLGEYVITAKSITITNVSAINRTYNGTTTVALTGGSLVGIETGDIVTFTLGTGTIADASTGTDKTVTTNIILSGAAATNYTLTQPTNIKVNITETPPPSSSSSEPQPSSSSSDPQPSSSSSEPQLSSSSSDPQPSSSSSEPQLITCRPGYERNESGKCVATPILSHKTATGNHLLTPTKNGITLTANTTATVAVYNLSGKLISRQNYNAGNHSISLGHLPKGVYIIQAQFRTGVARNAPTTEVLRLTIH
jgi:hypothetical protein